MSLSEKLSTGWSWFLQTKSEYQSLAMFHSECQPMKKNELMLIATFKVGSKLETIALYVSNRNSHNRITSGAIILS